MKVAPVLRALAAHEPGDGVCLVHTGQHYDAEMSDVFLDELGLPAPDVFLGVGSGTPRRADGASARRRRAGARSSARPTSSSSPATSTRRSPPRSRRSKLGIPVAHLEAGLRSFDPAMPEEHNRQLTDHLTDLLLAHSRERASRTSRARGSTASRIHLVGNTMIDSLFAHPRAARAAAPWSAFGVEPGGYGLVTLHRPALVDDPELLARDRRRRSPTLARDRAGRLPGAPAHAARLEASGDARLLERRRRARRRRRSATSTSSGSRRRRAFVLTDSGGVQEETSALGVPCFTLRDSTERPVTVELGTNTRARRSSRSGSPRSPRCSTTSRARRARSRSGTATPASAPPTCSREFVARRSASAVG